MKLEEMKAALTQELEAFKASLPDYAEKAAMTAKFDELTQKIEALNSDSLNTELTALKSIVEAQGLKIEKKITVMPKTKITASAELKEKKADIKALAKGDSSKAIVIEAALTNRAAITDNEQAWDLPDIGQLATRRLSMYDVWPKIRMNQSNNNGVVRYYDWDEATIVRAADMVAEGNVFPESTAKWKKYSIDLKKIGDTLPVTEEFFEDEQMFAAELGMFLETNVKLKEDDQLCNGDGTGNNLTGLYSSIDAYTPVASGIADASIYDLIVKVSESITTTGGSKYVPDVVFAPIAVINQMKLKKDANNNYIIPPFVSPDGTRVDGMLVIESNICPANTLVVGDRRFGRIYEKTGLELSKGSVGDQFIEDEMTLKARKRLLFLIRNSDKGGFAKVADVAAALETLAS